MAEYNKNSINQKLKLYQTLRSLLLIGVISCGASMFIYPSFAKELCLILVFLIWCVLLSHNVVLKWEIKQLRDEYADMLGEVKE